MIFEVELFVGKLLGGAVVGDLSTLVGTRIVDTKTPPRCTGLAGVTATALRLIRDLRNR